MNPFVGKKPLACLALACLLLACGDDQSSELTPAKKDEVFVESSVLADTNWIYLSDGKSLKGWHSYGQNAPGPAWEADNGVIHLTEGPKSKYQTAGGGDLVTDLEFDNFVFEIEWKVSKAANSGILFYVQEDTVKYKETWHSALELQVCDNEYNVDARVHKRDAGDIYDLVAATSRAAKGYGQWNKVVATFNNGILEVTLNGVKNLTVNIHDDNWKQAIARSKFKNMAGFGSFKHGRIGLQDHGAEVWYRNIRILRLN